MYDLIDNHLKSYYIKARKCVFFVGIALVIIFGIFSLFYPLLIIFLPIALTIDIIFLFSWRINNRKYGNKISYDKGTLIVYNYKGLKLREFRCEAMKTAYLQIAFNEYPKHTYRKCLVIYKDIELYENMEYDSYLNDPNIIIIQNPFIIEMIRNDNVFYTD